MPTEVLRTIKVEIEIKTSKRTVRTLLMLDDDENLTEFMARIEALITSVALGSS